MADYKIYESKKKARFSMHWRIKARIKLMNERTSKLSCSRMPKLNRKK